MIFYSPEDIKNYDGPFSRIYIPVEISENVYNIYNTFLKSYLNYCLDECSVIETVNLLNTQLSISTLIS